MIEGQNLDRIKHLLLTVPQERRQAIVNELLEGIKTEELGRFEPIIEETPHPDRPVSAYSWRQRRAIREFVPKSRKKLREALEAHHFSNLDDFIDRLRSQRSESSLTSLRNSTIDLVSYMIELDPSTGEPRLSKSTEIIIGNVQSGKSQAAMALACAALDMGTRVILVIAGTTDKLRNQTQRRFDRDLISRSANVMSPTTKGDLVTYRENNETSRKLWHHMEGNVHQFLNADESNAVILIVKKHAKILNAVYKLLDHIRLWGHLEDQPPILVIDDESDQAGQNAKTEYYDPEAEGSDASPIHMSLVNIVEEFDTAYWGMTATAAGAIVLHPRDPLFPNHAHVLEPHEFYLSAYEVFVENAEMMVTPNKIEDFKLPKYKKIVPFLKGTRVPPASMVATMVDHAISGALHHMFPRNPMPHGSRHACLVNVCRQIDGHDEVLRLVQDSIEKATALLRSAKLKQRKGTNIVVKKAISRFRENQRLISGAKLGFPDRRELLKRAIEVLVTTETVLLNSPSDDNLDYDRQDFPDNIVVIGSQLVSRGITIEGLRTTYYIHQPNEILDDSTIQYARWLGPYYQDRHLISIHLSNELITRFQNIAWSDSMLRDRLRHHKENDIPLLDIAIKHAKGHKPSSKNRHMSRQVTSGNRVQINSPWIGTDGSSPKALREGLEGLIASVKPQSVISNMGAKTGVLFEGVDNNQASAFLRGLKVGSNNRKLLSNLADRIQTIGEKATDSGVNIVIPNGSGSAMGAELPEEIRSELSRVKRASRDGSSVDQLISGMQQGTDILSSDWFCDNFVPESPTGKANGWRSLNEPSLIVVYVIDDHETKPLGGDGPWICVASHLPESGPGGAVSINKHSQRGEEE